MAATGVLTITTPEKVEEFSWNGVPSERAEAKARFDAIMGTRAYFAFVETSKGKQAQVRSFKEVEEYERKLGVAHVRVQPALVGG